MNRTNLPRIRPFSSHTRVAYQRFTRIINRSSTSVPARTIRQIVSVAQEVHNSFRDHSKPMAEYVRSECAMAAVMVGQRAREQVDGLKDYDTLRGIQIPGSPGVWMNLTGLHHVTGLYFENFEVAVDVTAAQIKGNPLFQNCEALVIITEPNGEAFTRALQQTYQNSQWMIMMFGF